MEKLIEKIENSDGYIVLTVNLVNGVFKVKIDYAESMTTENVDELLINVVETIKNRKK